GVFTNLTTQIMREFSFPLPPIDEQKKIVEILTSVDEKIYKEKETLNSLQSIKKGLMQILLAGKVRVKVDDEVVSS
ncbi:restriction endonuclease subunit S, partial [Streptococcus suis]